MCGRYQLSTEDEIFEIREIMKELNRQMLFKSGDIYPTDAAPVLVLSARAEAGDKNDTYADIEAQVMRWGFPKWDGKGHVINARVETVESKAMFKSAIGKRCVIPSTGFYEWTHAEKKYKEKFLLRAEGESTLYMAGIFHESRFTILTTEANESVAPLHNRMPVLLTRNDFIPWLSNIGSAREIMFRGQPRLTLTKQDKPQPFEQIGLF